MAEIEPTKIRSLPDALDPRPDDVFPVSQYDAEADASTTRGMRRDMFIADIIEAVNEARSELVNDFTQQNAQLQGAITALQTHDALIDGTITQINALDTALQATIAEVDQKVSNPVQWSNIQGKPSTYPASPFAVAPPTVVAPLFGTAYQAANPAKPSFVSAMIDTAYTITVASTLADTVELRIGPNQAQVAAGTGGFIAATFRASLTGIALVIGLGMGQRNQLTAVVPVGWWWALRRTQGTTATITSVTDQSLG